MNDPNEILFRTTTDHAEIRAWIEENDGRPVSVSGKETPGIDEGVIAVEFTNGRSRHATHIISWEEFFEKFDQAHLAFQYTRSPQVEFKTYYKFINCNGE